MIVKTQSFNTDLARILFFLTILFCSTYSIMADGKCEMGVDEGVFYFFSPSHPHSPTPSPSPSPALVLHSIHPDSHAENLDGVGAGDVKENAPSPTHTTSHRHPHPHSQGKFVFSDDQVSGFLEAPNGSQTVR